MIVIVLVLIGLLALAINEAVFWRKIAKSWKKTSESWEKSANTWEKTSESWEKSANTWEKMHDAAFELALEIHVNNARLMRRLKGDKIWMN